MQEINVNLWALLACLGMIWGMVTYKARPMKFFAIVSGYQLVTILMMSMVLTRWG